MKNTEFKATQFKDTTVYTLESASSGGTSSGAVASVSSPMGGVRKRGDNLIAQEANTDKIDASKPRNFVAKNAKTGGAGAHKDKKKAAKQGDVKHKNRQTDMAEGTEQSSDEILEKLTAAYRSCVKHRDSYTNFGNIQTVYELLRDPLMQGNIQGYEKVHAYVSGKYPDAFDLLMDEVPGQGVEEGAYDQYDLGTDEEDDTPELHSGCYVRDNQDSSGEVFQMRGDPYERRVQIVDRNGSGWNISPSRLVKVSDNDPAIGRYFGQGVAEADDHTDLLALADRHEKTGKWEWSQGNYEGAKQHYAKANELRDRAKNSQGAAEGLKNRLAELKQKLAEVKANPAYLHAAERSRSQAQATQRTFGKSPEEKAKARSTEIKRDKGIAGYSKRHRAEHPEMYPKPKMQPATPKRDPYIDRSDDYTTWKQGQNEELGYDSLDAGSARQILRQLDRNIPMQELFSEFPELSRMYDNIAGELGLHGDDDFEEIEGIIYDELSDLAQSDRYSEDHSTATGGWGQGAYATASSDTSRWTGAGRDDSVHEGDEYFNKLAESLNTVQEKMMPASMFAGSKKNKLSTAGQWRNTGSKKNRPAKQGDLVGGAEESIAKESAPKGWKGTVKAMKKHKEIDNPFALANYMKKKGAKPHYPNVGEDAYSADLAVALERVLQPNDPVEKWNAVFQAADFNRPGNFQFGKYNPDNRTPEKRERMAKAASYAAKNPSKKK